MASRAFLERAQRGELTLCLTSQVLAEFFSIVTSVKRVSNPRTPEEAMAAIQAMLAIPGVDVLPVPSDVTSRWLDTLSRHPLRGGAVFDLQLIATVPNGLLTGAAGQINGTTRAGHNVDRVGVGTGVYGLGAPRQIEFGLRLTF